MELVGFRSRHAVSCLVDLAPDSSLRLVFQVNAETTGKFPLVVTIETPGTPARTIPSWRTQLIVRSTAYDRVALVITIGAGLFLAVWWGRGVFRRRRS